MARRQRLAKKMSGKTLDKSNGGTARDGSGPAADDVLVSFAEDLGKLLGTAQAKASSWLDQRKAIADHLTGLRAIAAQLTQIRDTAGHYLEQLSAGGGGLVEGFRGKRRGRPPGSGRKGTTYKAPAAVVKGKRKGGMSAEGRARVAAAQKARWAKVRAEKARAARAADR